ncbi:MULTISPECIES: hypothetical protein [Nocardiaceae]|uniref:hypothetical protein n=1 Tax=Nocardiaceae TaxID=85025 RepID=UPI001B4D2E06|nr:MULTISPECIES: hypothetical protein [Rhodococcus]MBP1118149.1 hypothetical protein [Rhodococcus sp. PvP016]
MIGVVVVSVRDSRDAMDTSALPSVLSCRIQSTSEPLSKGATVNSVPPSVLAKGGTAELLDENQLLLKLEFSGPLPPPPTNVGTSEAPFSVGLGYAFIINLDRPETHAYTVFRGDNGWELTDFGDGSAPGTVLDDVPNITVGPDFVDLILELDKLPVLPKRLDPVVYVDTTSRTSPYADVDYYLEQACE